MADKSGLPTNLPKTSSVRSLILCCIVCGILVLAMILPAFVRTRECANIIRCHGNIHSIGQALLTYAEANKGKPPVDWNILVKSGHLSAKHLCCPCTDHPNYMYIRQVSSPTTREAGDVKMLNTRDFNAPIMFEPLDNHGGEGGNILFIDGHIEWYPKEQYERILGPYKDRAIKVEVGGSVN